MSELPGGLDYPDLRLLQLQHNHKKLKIAGDFFHGMRGLKVFNGTRICNVILPPTLGLLTNLQALSLENCDLDGDLSTIGCLKGLKTFSFYGSKLHEFPRGVGELKNLNFLDLRCRKESSLKYIKASLLSGLDKLEVVYMGHCLVSSSKELNSLSRLTALEVCFSNSMILLEFEESFFDKLKRFEVSISDKGEFYHCGQYGITKNAISVKSDDLSWVSHTKLRSLVRRIQSFILEGLDENRFMSDERESGFSVLSNFKSLEGSFSHRLKKKFDSTTLENLERVIISSCHSMEVVFDLEGLKYGGEDSPCVFDKLASICLVRLEKLAHVWRMVPDGVQGFRNLITLEVYNCKELRYLMSYSVAKMLVNLKVLKLVFCSEIVSVIEGEDKESSTAAELNECIVFPQLRKLVLRRLEKLTFFCSSKCSLEFPVLDKVDIRRCLNMKRFCGGEVKAPVLKQPVEDPNGGEWFWEGNLNNSIHRESMISDDDDYDDEVNEYEAEGDESDDNKDHDADNNN